MIARLSFRADPSPQDRQDRIYNDPLADRSFARLEKFTGPLREGSLPAMKMTCNIRARTPLESLTACLMTQRRTSSALVFTANNSSKSCRGSVVTG